MAADGGGFCFNVSVVFLVADATAPVAADVASSTSFATDAGPAAVLPAHAHLAGAEEWMGVGNTFRSWHVLAVFLPTAGKCFLSMATYLL